MSNANAELGQEVDHNYVTEVPLFNRQVLNLAFLAPGVTEAAGGNNQATGVNFVSNGQRNSTAEVRLDGVPSTAPENGEGGMNNVGYQPPLEIVQEFKVQTNSFSAEYGSNGGTVINVVTNSGTNQIHGAAFWFGRRPELDANDFYDNRAGNPKPDFSYDQYGGALGGPIRKDKTFFFFDVERITDSSPTVITQTVPTAAERLGDFSASPPTNLQSLFSKSRHRQQRQYC